MKLDAQAESDLRGHLPRLLSRARRLLELPPSDDARLAPRELKRASGFVSELHQGLVGERTLARATTYDRRALLGAYLLWWWPQSYARVRAALSMAPAPLPFALARPDATRTARDSSRAATDSARAPIRILDLGAGPGPAALAIADALLSRGHRVELLLVDESELALTEARALAEHRPQLRLRTERIDLASPSALTQLGARAPGTFELICAAHLLSELPPGANERARFLNAICAAQLAPQGALLVVEPALRETGRALLEVRDLLLAAPDPSLERNVQSLSGPRPARLRALAPCLTQAPCPALKNPRDWCTAEIAWTAPPHLVQLSRELGLHADAPLSFAPLLLSREVAPPPEHLWRVVGLPPPEKGKKRLFVCAGPGRLAVSRLDRDAGEATRAFDQAARGDLLHLEGMAARGDGLRLARDAKVALVAGDRGAADDEAGAYESARANESASAIEANESAAAAVPRRGDEA